MFRSILACFICFFSIQSLAQQASATYAGIWQDTNQTDDYYVIQEKDDNLVLVALPGIEASGDTLRYSYIGNKQELVFTRLSPDTTFDDIYHTLKLSLPGEDTAVIMPVCEVCSVIPINLVRVF